MARIRPRVAALLLAALVALVVASIALLSGGDERGGAPQRTGAAARTAPRDPLRYGISGEDPAMFADARFGALGLHSARLQVSWDLIAHGGRARFPGVSAERPRVAAWLAGARAAGITDVLLSIKPSRDEPARVPNAAVYAAAVTALLDWVAARDGGQLVHSVSPWNEPDLSASTRDDPAAAGRLYARLRTLCAARGCTPVAGDFADGPMTPEYLTAYRAAAGRPEPRIWAWHAYEDGWDRDRDPTLPRLRAFLGAIPPDVQVWLTEQGGIVRRLRAGPDGRSEQSPVRAAADLEFLLDRTRALDQRITRFDVYQFRGEAPPRWDSGLISPAGAERASYAVFRAALRERLSR